MHSGHSREEPAAVVFARYGIQPAGNSYHQVVLRVDVVFVSNEHLHCRKNQQRAEDVGNPLEPLDQRRSDANHNAACDNRTKHPPEQQPMLDLGGNTKKGNHQRDDEDVIDRE